MVKGIQLPKEGSMSATQTTSQLGSNTDSGNGPSPRDIARVIRLLLASNTEELDMHIDYTQATVGLNCNLVNNR